MKLNPKEILKPTLILFVICVLVTAALAGTNLLTEDRIAEQQGKKSEESRRIVLSTAETFTEEETTTGTVYHVGTAGGETVGFVFTTTAKGYGGDLSVMTGITTQGEISGIVILSHSETPGLGANAEREEFREQYRQSVTEEEITVVKYQTPTTGQIEAMTGATITSKAVTSAVNEAVSLYQEVKGGN